MDAGLASVASSGNNPIVKRTLAGGKDAAVQTAQGGARQIDSMESIDSKFGTSLRIRDFVRAAIVWDCVTRYRAPLSLFIVNIQLFRCPAHGVDDLIVRLRVIQL